MLTTALELPFADGVYLFDLKLPQMAELQEKRGPIFEVYGRVLQGRYIISGRSVSSTIEGKAFAEDLFETVRLGLIGGGRGVVGEQEIEVSALSAKTLVERYCHPAPLKETWAVAAAVLGARIEGFEPPKKAPPADEPAPEAPRKSTSRKSSRTAKR